MASLQPVVPFPFQNALSEQRLSPQQRIGKLSPHRKPQSPGDGIANEFIEHVPGEPTISLSKIAVCNFLESELTTPVLDELYDHLWLVARKSGRSIDPLHRQRVKTRDIVATEDSHLHLVWHHDKIYVKPMPLCLLNYDFWETFLPLPGPTSKCAHIISQGLSESTFDYTVAVGFMRSYSFLVQHHIDFVLAREAHLFPIELDWIKWSEFIAHFRGIEDKDVSRRYHYGQLRLSRLNWAVRLFQPSSATTKWFYHIPHWSTTTYLGQVVSPLLFGFASLALALSSMQVLLSVPDEKLGFANLDTDSLMYMRQAFWVFSNMVLFLSGIVWVLLLIIPCSTLLWQLGWGFRNRERGNHRAKQSACEVPGKV